MNFCEQVAQHDHPAGSSITLSFFAFLDAILSSEAESVLRQVKVEEFIGQVHFGVSVQFPIFHEEG